MPRRSSSISDPPTRPSPMPAATVLTRQRDHIALNGIDLWRGSVHLAGTDRSPWRGDALGETLVS
jgi:hypothetical protein